jgi:hypothetical protein
MVGGVHGGVGAPHFVVDLSKSTAGLGWEYVETLPGNGGNPADPQQPGEPTPVYEGGAPGDNATVRCSFSDRELFPCEEWWYSLVTSPPPRRPLLLPYRLALQIPSTH